MIYTCPLCSLPLNLEARTYVCGHNHRFDLAKEGYINLMPAHHKHSKNPGDSKEMMQSRRQFLESGHYQSLQQALANKVAECVNHHDQTTAILDIGCGEGYYTNAIAKAVSTQTQVYGLDISKVAIRYASKRYPSCQFSVASSYKLPFADNSLDAIIKIYAPSKQEELLRCLKPSGILITVTPGQRHLFQLRERIYTQVRLHEEAPESFEGLTFVETTKLNYPMQLQQGIAFDLLQMTPFAWKASDELRAELVSAEVFECEADFNINLYKVTE